jgi:hypothetical protein
MTVLDSRQKTDGRPALNVPIYFIGHSFGGLVIEQALVECIKSDASLKPVAEQAAGIIFMGTPHEGSHLAKWGQLMLTGFRAIIPKWVKNTNKEILKALEQDSPVCERVQIAFQSAAKHDALKHLQLFCFYETIPMGGTEIVPKNAAIIKSDPNAPLHGTHTEIVKFQAKQDPGYVAVKALLTKWTEPKLKEESDKQPQGGRSVNVSGAQIASISGGNVDVTTMGVGGGFYDLKSQNNQGEITGKKNYSGGDFKWGSGAFKKLNANNEGAK